MGGNTKIEVTHSLRLIWARLGFGQIAGQPDLMVHCNWTGWAMLGSSAVQGPKLIFLPSSIEIRTCNITLIVWLETASQPPLAVVPLRTCILDPQASKHPPCRKLWPHEGESQPSLSPPPLFFQHHLIYLTWTQPTYPNPAWLGSC